MSHLRVVNRTRGTVVGSRVDVANGVWSRVRGYLGRPEPTEGEGLLLAPCNAVHMFGMTYPLDVLFLDARGEVVEVVENLQPWRRSRRVRGARYALEVPAGTIDATSTCPGDELAWMPPRAATTRAKPHADPGKHTIDQHEGAPATPARRS